VVKKIARRRGKNCVSSSPLYRPPSCISLFYSNLGLPSTILPTMLWLIISFFQSMASPCLQEREKSPWSKKIHLLPLLAPSLKMSFNLIFPCFVGARGLHF
jgi:hypothetical protein